MLPISKRDVISESETCLTASQLPRFAQTAQQSPVAFPYTFHHAPLLARARRTCSPHPAQHPDLMGSRSPDPTTSHASRRKEAHLTPPPIYSRDFAYSDTKPVLVSPGPRMAGSSIRDTSAAVFAEYVLSLSIAIAQCPPAPRRAAAAQQP